MTFLPAILLFFMNELERMNNGIKVVRDPCQKITLLLLKSKSVSFLNLVFKRENLFVKR